MRTLTEDEVNEVSGGLSADVGGVAIMTLGATVWPLGMAVPIFGFAIGGSLLYLHHQKMKAR